MDVPAMGGAFELDELCQLEDAVRKTVAQMTVSDLRALIGEIIEDKLLELMRDPDEGLQLRDSVRRRLEHQQQSVRAGERGQSLRDVAESLGLS